MEPLERTLNPLFSIIHDRASLKDLGDADPCKGVTRQGGRIRGYINDIPSHVPRFLVLKKKGGLESDHP